MRMRAIGSCFIVVGLSFGAVPAAPRDVMIRSIDTIDRILELHNFGAGNEDLSGYQFCSHDEGETRRYSGSTGLNGVTIEAGTSIFMHFNNDAPADPDHLNMSSLGGVVAGPLDNGPFSISLYFPPIDFNDGTQMASPLQWSIDGTDNSTADERSDEAENGGLWTNQSLWVSTGTDTTRIALKPGAETTVLHGPDDYFVFGPPREGSQAVALCGDVAHYAWVRLDDGGTNPNILYRNCVVDGNCGPISLLVGVSTEETNPKVACSDTSVLVAWEDTRRLNTDLFYRRSTDGGETFEGLQGLVSSPTDEKNLALAMEGSVVVAVWEDLRKGNPHIALRRSENAGETFGPLKFVVSSPADETHPALTLEGSDLLVAWEDNRRGNIHVGYKQSIDGGATFGNIKFLVSSPVNETRPVLGRTGDLIVAAWEDPRRGNRNIFSRRSMNGGDSWGPLQAVVSSLTEEIRPVLAMEGSEVLVAWEDYRAGNSHVGYKLSTNSGASYGPLAFVVSAPTDEFDPVCDLAGGLAACVWSDTRTGQPEARARESLDGGVTWGPMRRLD